MHRLIEKDVSQMSADELHKHVEMLRNLRRVPQNLSAKLQRDEAARDLEHGEPEDKQIRKRVKGETTTAVRDKKDAQVAASMANKYLDDL